MVVDGALCQNPEEMPIVKTVFYEYDDKKSTLADICDVLQERGYHTRKNKRFQPSTVRSILPNRKFYEGFYRYGDANWVKGVHEPILKEVTL